MLFYFSTIPALPGQTICAMFKTLIFILFLAPGSPGLRPMAPATSVDCACPEVTSVHKTGSTSTSLSYAWTGSGQAVQYKVWYVRQEGGYTSPDYFTTSASYTFSNLSAGHYTLYFVTVCGGESSGFIGIEDLVCI